MVRAFGRAADQIRPIKVSYDVFEYAEASVFFELGKTKVLCAISVQNSVPPFLKGKKIGWLNAEYAMLPTSTHTRKDRETGFKQNGRSIEISRLIGRVLRSVVSLEHFGERTIIVDCDVVQADGGTRTACISGAYLALKNAVDRWLDSGKIAQTILKDDLAAISVGLKDGELLLDLDFTEDSSVGADFNFVMTRSGDLVELQGCAEQKPMSWHYMEKMRSLAYKGVQDIFKQSLSDDHQSIPKKQPFNGIRMNLDEKSV